MESNPYKFDSTTLLITHFNRSQSLERLLKSFVEAGISFKDIIVSDDASNSQHLEYIQTLRLTYDFDLITTPVNKGLGNNLNKGQDAVKTKYTLYVQEDFTPLDACLDYLKEAHAIMAEDESIDTIRFYSYLDYPVTLPYRNGFSKMVFEPWSFDVSKIPMYSDHPHLRKSNFFEKFGRYTENKKSDQVEYDMMVSFLKNDANCLLADNYREVFEQTNSAAEPSTVKRNSLRYSGSVLISIPRFIYRIIKFNYRYFIKDGLPTYRQAHGR
jgi:glycosyltransferase involved in cell wall biosynthesis